MNDTWVTVVGNLATEPAPRTTGSGVPVVNLRVATTPRRRDGVTGEWKDAETAFLTVTCWRSLAEHVGRSLRKGDPVVVYGRLLHKTYETAQGERRSTTEVEASSLGPDLARGTAAFVRAGRGRLAEAAPATPGPSGHSPWSDGPAGPGGEGDDSWAPPVEAWEGPEGDERQERPAPGPEPIPAGV